MAATRKRYMKAHGQVFMILGIMQHFWYRSDKRREGFVAMCNDKDVQRLTWESYLNKKLVRRDPLAHLRGLQRHFFEGGGAAGDVGVVDVADGDFITGAKGANVQAAVLPSSLISEAGPVAMKAGWKVTVPRGRRPSKDNAKKTSGGTPSSDRSGAFSKPNRR